MKKTLLLAFIFLSLGFVSTAQEIIFSEDFEGGALPVGWSIVTKATDGGYVIGTTADISSQSFVIPDHGKFAGTNDDKCNCNKSDDQLKTGVMDLSTYTTLFLQFDSYYLKSAYQGVSESLFLDLSTDGGVTWTAMPLNTAFGNKWVEANQVDVSAIAGSPTAMIRFRYNDGGGWLYGAGFDNISLYQPADYDIKMLAISPTNKDKCFFGAEETVKITIKNIGLYAASGFDIKYTLYLPDGSEVEVIEPVFDVVEPNQTITLTFDTKADMSAAGAYSIVAEVIYGDDWVPENNVLQVDMEFTSGEVKLTGTGSNYGDQLWKLYTIAGDLVATGGDWAKNLPFSEVACVSDAVCYYMTYEAASGSGATAANPNFKITYNGNVIFIPDAIVDPGYVVPIHRDFKIFAIGSACPAINAALSNVFIPAIIKLNSPQQIEGTVTNQGRDTLHSFDVTYTIDGGVPKVQTFNVDLAPSRSLTFTHDSAVVITSGFTKRDLLVEVDNFNGGEPDADLSDNSASLKFDVVEELADKRVVFEEATGTWCQWCPRGAVYLEKVTSENPESAIGIAIHNGDPMTVTAWDAMMGQYIGGYPSGLADRRLNNIDPLEFPDALPRILKYYPAIASVETNATFDQATRELNIQVSANMIIDNTGEYRLNAFIVEDGLKGTTSGWAQVNA
ncbi:MAG: hypothetical protein ABIV51_02590, partial [Saprospiraceae bacterium]